MYACAVHEYVKLLRSPGRIGFFLFTHYNNLSPVKILTQSLMFNLYEHFNEQTPFDTIMIIVKFHARKPVYNI